MTDSISESTLENVRIDTLIADLRNADGMTRQRARRALVAIDESAVDPLIRAFEDRGEQMHWEVAKTLSEIGSTKTIQCFIRGLEDEDFSVRWLSCEGLIVIGEVAVYSLLRELALHFTSTFIIEGVHHILHDLVNRKMLDEQTEAAVSGVLKAYDHLEPQLYIPLATMKALDELKPRPKN